MGGLRRSASRNSRAVRLTRWEAASHAECQCAVDAGLQSRHARSGYPEQSARIRREADLATAANEIWDRLRGGLIVSCQAEGDDPFNSPHSMALFARAAEMGGASGIRGRETDNIRAIREAVSLPIIGLTKSQFSDGTVLITADITDAETLVAAAADIVAVDATSRTRPNGMTGPDFVAAVKSRLGASILADVSCLEEGLAALEAVATTLAGYTAAAAASPTEEPDWELLANLVRAARAPIIMEGRIWSPIQAACALELGAHAVVVGTAITRPRVVTRTFVERMRSRPPQP